MWRPLLVSRLQIVCVHIVVETKPQTSYYRWRGANGGPAVLISEAIIGEIRDHVFTGFKASPRPGAELGGALLGAISSDGREIVIDEFEPLQIEHKFGTPYILSDSDYAQWHQWLRALRQAFPRLVGICRSHTRPGLRVTPEDNVLIKQFMDGEQGVLLLVKPLSERDCVGAFYPFSNGRILNGATTSEEFPFGAAAPEPPGLAESSGHKSRPWIPLTAVVVGVGAALALHCSSDSSKENPVPKAAPRASSVPGKARIHAARAAGVTPPATPPADVSNSTPAVYGSIRPSTEEPVDVDKGDEASVPPPKPTVKWSVPPPAPAASSPPAAVKVPAAVKAGNPAPLINSFSENALAKPAPPRQASAATEDEDSVRVKARLTTRRQEPTPAIKSHEGRLHRFVGGFTSKATHLWPFHSDKQEPPIQ